MTIELHIDENRMHIPKLGIYVRAKHGDEWGHYDIVHLDKRSLWLWLRSRKRGVAEKLVLMLLRHDVGKKTTDDP